MIFHTLTKISPLLSSQKSFLSLTKKFAVSKLRIFVSGENLWTGTSLTKIFDPETIGGGDEYNGNAYPLSRTFSVGLNVTL